MNYTEATTFLNGSLKYGMRLGLSEIRHLMNLLGNPQNAYETIHIAGTNGKGSVAMMISQMLIKSGYSVGTFISPHIIEYTETVYVNGHTCSKELFATATDMVKNAIENDTYFITNPLTSFEILTAIMYQLLKNIGVKYAVIETGLGGELDSTNVIDNPIFTILTSISMDHMNILGTSIEAIATAKAGIIKKNSITLSSPENSPLQPLLKTIALNKGSQFIQVLPHTFQWNETFDQVLDLATDQTLTPLIRGEHQVNNIAIVKMFWSLFLDQKGNRLAYSAFVAGVESAMLPCRLEWLSAKPAVLLDGAHNMGSITSLIAYIKQLNFHGTIFCILGLLADKEIAPILESFSKNDFRFILTQPINPRCLAYESLYTQFPSKDKVIGLFESPFDAMAFASKSAGPNGLIVVAGSFYLSYYIRQSLMDK